MGGAACTGASHIFRSIKHAMRSPENSQTTLKNPEIPSQGWEECVTFMDLSDSAVP